MTMHSRPFGTATITLLAVLLACAATPTELAAQAGTLNIIYVNAETGDDTYQPVAEVVFDA